MVETLTRNWGWVALRGLVAILFGVLTFVNPGITLAALILLFGAWALVDGISMIVSAIANRHGHPGWGVLLFGGVLAIGTGLVTFFMPGVTAIVLLTLIAFWAIVTGFAEIVAAIRLRREITGEWMLVLAGSLAVAFGLVLMMAPGVGAMALVLWIGAYAIISGMLLVALGFRLRSWGQMHGPGATPHPA